MGAGTHGHRRVVVGEFDETNRPQEVRVDGGENDEETDQGNDCLNALTAADRRRQRVTHGHIALEGDGDDEPAGVVADGVPDDADESTSPVGGVPQIVPRQLADPQPHEADVQHEGVGRRQHGQVDVGRILPHGRSREDHQGEHVTDGAEKEQHWRNVQQQLLV